MSYFRTGNGSERRLARNNHPEFALQAQGKEVFRGQGSLRVDSLAAGNFEEQVIQLSPTFLTLPARVSERSFTPK